MFNDQLRHFLLQGILQLLSFSPVFNLGFVRSLRVAILNLQSCDVGTHAVQCHLVHRRALMLDLDLLPQLLELSLQLGDAIVCPCPLSFFVRSRCPGFRRHRDAQGTSQHLIHLRTLETSKHLPLQLEPKMLLAQQVCAAAGQK